MTDPLTLGLASTAVGLVNGTIGLLKEARAAAKTSDDHDLKDKLSEVFDAVLELKEAVGNLRDENDELRAKLDTKTALKWDSSSKLYLAENDPDPFCPACFDENVKQIRLQPSVTADGELVGHKCKVCSSYFEIQPRRAFRSSFGANPGSTWG